METLIVQLKNKNEAEKIKGILDVLKTKYQILEELNDEIFGEIMEKSAKKGYMSHQESENFIKSLQMK